MRVSIITPSFNQDRFIESTILSVVHQDHPDIEHIVIDGGSSDGTVAILQKYPHLKWISERDRGQSAAINKGFAMASGEVLAWINSDDCLAENVLGDVVRHFETHPECMLLYGDIAFMDRDGQPLYTIGGPVLTFDALVACPDSVRQPSTFWRRSVLDEVGGIDESLHVVLDFDFFLRIAARHRPQYLSRILSNYRTYPETKSRSMTRRQWREFVRVYWKHGVHPTWPMLRFLLAKWTLAYGLGPVVRPLVHGSRRLRRMR